MTKRLSAPPLELDWSQFGSALELESPSDLSTAILRRMRFFSHGAEEASTGGTSEPGLPEPIVEEVSLAEWDAVRARGRAST